MSEHSAIGWTDATWNPVTGCSHVSPGCVHCYAESLSLRRGWSKKSWTAKHAAENVVLRPDRLRAPLRWREPRRVFVNSMSDLFHERIPDEFIDKVFAVMALARQHTFQVLTKRAKRMRSYMQRLEIEPCSLLGYAAFQVAGDRASEGISNLFELAAPDDAFPFPNVWLGVSAEDQQRWDERVEYLGQVPAAVRFVSAEPLLGYIDPGNAFDPPPDGSPYGPLHWVIIGGETGPKHRQMQVGWAESLTKQCALAGVPVFVKQDSGPRPGKQGRLSDALWARKDYPPARTS